MVRGKKQDLTNMKFGMLTVVSKDEELSKLKRKTHWKCICECGNYKTCRSDSLLNNKNTHCGCSPSWATHNKTNTRLFNIWSGMKNRCYNQNSKDYKNYGGRGIKICKEWLNNFESFYKWAMNNGYSDDLSIDRIEGNEDYEPSNCRWADEYTQQNNTRMNTRIEISGETKSLSEWARISGVSRTTIRLRYEEGIRGLDLLSKSHEAKKKSGVKGIRWDKTKQSWRVTCRYNSKEHYVGYIKDLDEAIKRQNEFINKLK